MENESPKPISEFVKFLEYHVLKNLKHLKAGWFAVCIIVAGALYAGYWFAGKVDEKELKGKDATIQSLQVRADNFQKDNEILQRENRELKVSLAEFTAPLKKRILILTSQLNEFARACGTNAAPVWSNEYGNRFEHRVNTIIAQLDELGQHSDLLSEAASHTPYYMERLITNSIIISRELTRLANNLKD